MIAIYSTYARSETTYAATQLADLCLELGHQVRLYAHGLVGASVHTHWDRQTKIGKLSEPSAFVWFGENDACYAEATRTVPSALRVLVPVWSREKPDGLGQDLPRYDIIVSTSARLQDRRMRQFAADVHGRGGTRWAVVPWIASPAFEPTDLKNRKHTLVTAGPAAMRQAPETVLDLVDLLLQSPDDHKVLLWPQASWSRPARKTLRDIAKAYPRLEVLGHLPFDRWGEVFSKAKQHICLEPRSDFGILQTEAARHGVPTMAYACESLRSTYSPSSWLIPGDVYEEQTGLHRHTIDSQKAILCFDQGRQQARSSQAVKHTRSLYTAAHKNYVDFWQNLFAE